MHKLFSGRLMVIAIAMCLWTPVAYALPGDTPDAVARQLLKHTFLGVQATDSQTTDSAYFLLRARQWPQDQQFTLLFSAHGSPRTGLIEAEEIAVVLSENAKCKEAYFQLLPVSQYLRKCPLPTLFFTPENLQNHAVLRDVLRQVYPQEHALIWNDFKRAKKVQTQQRGTTTNSEGFVRQKVLDSPVIFQFYRGEKFWYMTSRATFLVGRPYTRIIKEMAEKNEKTPL